MSIKNVFFELQRVMIDPPSATPKIYLGGLHAYGTVKPVSGTAGYQKGCIFQNTAATGATCTFRNIGTVTGCSFVLFS